MTYRTREIRKPRAQGGPYSVTLDDDYLVTTTGDFAVMTLPNPAPDGFILTLKNNPASTTYMSGATGGGDTIDGALTSLQIYPGQAKDFVYDLANTTWWSGVSKRLDANQIVGHPDTGVATVTAVEVLNKGTDDGETRTKEHEITTPDDTPTSLAEYVVPTNSIFFLDVEVLAIAVGATQGTWWKKSKAWLNTADTLTAGTQRDVDTEDLGGVTGYTLTLDDDGVVTARVRVVGDPGANVTWYLISQRIRVLPAP